jgi:hypothetical protein
VATRREPFLGPGVFGLVVQILALALLWYSGYIGWLETTVGPWAAHGFDVAIRALLGGQAGFR